MKKYAGLALLGVAALAASRPAVFGWAGWAFLAGIVLFSVRSMSPG